ncbi:F-box/LRR-repeat protein 4-like [Euphorbia lathyris]|uniref:F-box/LRR-repeat protein 4-like n=1 Tax=Euphorbia lathyris TaxID=212925 RepID=UPI003313831F
MSKLGDDELAAILMWVYDQNDRKSSSEVCKQWLRVEGQTRLSIRVFEPDLLHKFLPRFPNLLTFESSKHINNAHLDFIAKTCPKLQFLNLNLKQSRRGRHYDGSDELLGSDDFGDDAICGLANGCPKLIKVVLRRRRNVGNLGVIELVKNAHDLTTLDLGRCGLIDDRSLEAIGGMKCIRVLNLEGCSLITDCGLELLSIGSSAKTLKKLVVSECDRITDFGVSLLVRFDCLEELNLAECGPKVTDYGGLSIASIPTLKKLNISWLINISDITIVAIAENKNIVALDLTGCEMITGAGICAFAPHKCLESLVLASCYNISGNAVERLFRCESLSYIVLDKRLKMWIPDQIQQQISRSCQLHWR